MQSQDCVYLTGTHKDTHSVLHTLRPPLPNWNNPCPCWPLLRTHRILLDRHVAAGTAAANLTWRCFQGSACDCRSITVSGEWNARIVKLLAALSPAAGYAMCLCVRFLPLSWKSAGRFIVKQMHVCVHRERRAVFTKRMLRSWWECVDEYFTFSSRPNGRKTAL